MNLAEFKASVDNGNTPPPDIGPHLESLWYAAKGDWDESHTIIQAQGNPDGSWVHAYLHRVEGDLSNAGYWYTRAGRTMPEQSLEEEWEEITAALLKLTQ